MLLRELRQNVLAASHPVVMQLLRILETGSVATMGAYVERAVVALGRPYIGLERPKGFRKGRNKECFINADRLANEGKGTYVEGFAISPDWDKLIHHAWVTTDGSNAIEVTWKHQANACHYFGIPFPLPILARWEIRLNYFGVLDCEPSVQDELLAELKAANLAASMGVPPTCS